MCWLFYCKVCGGLCFGSILNLDLACVCLFFRYLNDKAVQKAIHAPNIKWEMCNAETLHYSRSDLLSSMLPVYRNLFGKIRILVYSGDVDGMVPNTG